VSINQLLSNRFWRLNNLYYITDKQGQTNLFNLNFAQRIVDSVKHPREITLKSRQQGISTKKVIDALDACLMIPNYQAGIQSYGKVEAKKLYNKAMFAYERLDPDIKTLLNINIKSASAQEGVTFTNGSSLRIGNFRGDTLQRFHISELAKIAKVYPEKAKEIKTGALQAVATNNIVSIESTAEGAQGMFYEMWKTATARKNTTLKLKQQLTPLDFYPIFLSWVIDPDCNLQYHYEPSQEALDYFDTVEEFFNYKDADGIFINRQYLIYPKLDNFGNILSYLYKADNFNPLPKNIMTQGQYKLTQYQKNWAAAKLDELSDYMNQEYPYSPDSAFNLPLHGTFFKSQYALLMRERYRLQPLPYDPAYPVYVSFDIGAKDYTVMYFAQVKPTTLPDGSTELRPHILWEYESNDTLGVEHFIEVIYKARCPLTKKEFFPNYRAIILPHDAFSHDFTTGRSAAEIMMDKGLPVSPLPELLKFSTSIQVARDFINIMFCNPNLNLLVGIQNYRRRYDKQLQVYLDTDVHDINSDRAASLRYLAQYLFFDTKIKPRDFTKLH